MRIKSIKIIAMFILTSFFFSLITSGNYVEQQNSFYDFQKTLENNIESEGKNPFF